MRRTVLIGALSVALLATLAVLFREFPPAYALQNARAEAAAQQLGAARDLSEAFEQVADIIRPSVVSVRSARRVAVNDPFQGSPFGDFFGPNGPFQMPEPRDYVERGLGTGVIVSADGYILTNNHVVGNADEVSVQLPDNRELRAKVVGTDPKTDLAVLKVSASSLRPAKLGDSDLLRIGEWVIAAGNPFGLSSSITAGIVSAKGRTIGAADYEDLIQTDAAINPGNSGGPLVDLRGEVVGINTAIFTRTGGYMGIGFAIPIKMASRVMNSLIASGKVVRGWLGVSIQDLTPELAQSFGFRGTQGALIGDVTPGSPAGRAGLRSGDIITAFGGRRINDVATLRGAVADTKPGRRVPVEIFRGGAKQTVTVQVTEQDQPVAAASGAGPASGLGLETQTLTPQIARQLGSNVPARGVVVTDVEPLSPAERAGLQQGDVIVSVQGQPVRDVSEFRRGLSQRSLANGVRLGVQTGGVRRFVVLKSSLG